MDNCNGCLFGFALGTKFNIIFASLVIIPWFLFYLSGGKGFVKNFLSFLKGKRLIISLMLIPIIGLAIIFAFWPYLWQDPIRGFLR